METSTIRGRKLGKNTVFISNAGGWTAEYGRKDLKRQHSLRVRTCFIISVSLIFMETRLTFIFGTWSFMKPFKPLLVRKHFFISSHRCVDVHVFTASPLCALGAGLPHEPRGSAVRAVYQHIIMQPFRRKNTCSSWLHELNLLICIFQAEVAHVDEARTNTGGSHSTRPLSSSPTPPL